MLARQGQKQLFLISRDESLGVDIQSTVAEQNNQDVYKVLNDMMKDIPAGSSGLLCMPYFAAAASPRWNSDARGMFIGLTFSHTRAHMARSCMEGIALEQRDIIQGIKENGIKTETVRIIGGATKSEIWNQIQADVYNIPTETLMVKDAGSLGSAMCGAVGIGLYKDLREAAVDLAKPDRRYEPIPENVQIYDDLFGVYCDIYEAMDEKGVYKRLSDMQK